MISDHSDIPIRLIHHSIVRQPMFAGGEGCAKLRGSLRNESTAGSETLLQNTNQFQFEFAFIFVSDFELPIPKFLASPALTYIGPRSNIQDCHTSVMNLPWIDGRVQVGASF